MARSYPTEGRRKTILLTVAAANLLLAAFKYSSCLLSDANLILQLGGQTNLNRPDLLARYSAKNGRPTFRRGDTRSHRNDLIFRTHNHFLIGLRGASPSSAPCRKRSRAPSSGDHPPAALVSP